MATREENLKKINEELEKLDDEELEKIAGGVFFHKSDSEQEKILNSLIESTKFYKKL